MIGKITGTIEYRGSDHVLIDVGGLGYVVHCSARTLAALPEKGAAVALYTDLLVREDLFQLFGFPTLLEKEWHRLLTSVQGIGAKASLAILGTLGVEVVARAVAVGDVGTITAAKGIGPKIAQRVVNELRDKVPEIMALAATLEPASLGPEATSAHSETPEAPGRQDAQNAAPPAPSAPNLAVVQAEALSALRNLGYSAQEAARAVAEALTSTPDPETAPLVRAALKTLAPKNE
ncbi:MAG: Holliday junction branch migration protein RuvA [Rhodobacteraceae bacterium]|nr:Holliday junction branch migration protein RuvA [Paracoccaceae bacterium]